MLALNPGKAHLTVVQSSEFRVVSWALPKVCYSWATISSTHCLMSFTRLPPCVCVAPTSSDLGLGQSLVTKRAPTPLLTPA